MPLSSCTGKLCPTVTRLGSRWEEARPCSVLLALQDKEGSGAFDGLPGVR